VLLPLLLAAAAGCCCWLLAAGCCCWMLLPVTWMTKIGRGCAPDPAF